MGAGLDALGSGELAAGSEVSEQQLQLLVGMGRDPITGDPLGRPYPAYKSTAQRIEERTAAVDESLSVVERAKAVAAIEAKESASGVRWPGLISRFRFRSQRVHCGRSLTAASNRLSLMLIMRRLLRWLHT